MDQERELSVAAVLGTNSLVAPLTGIVRTAVVMAARNSETIADRFISTRITPVPFGEDRFGPGVCRALNPGSTSQ